MGSPYEFAGRKLAVSSPYEPQCGQGLLVHDLWSVELTVFVIELLSLLGDWCMAEALELVVEFRNDRAEIPSLHALLEESSLAE